MALNLTYDPRGGNNIDIGFGISPSEQALAGMTPYDPTGYLTGQNAFMDDPNSGIDPFQTWQNQLSVDPMMTGGTDNPMAAFNLAGPGTGQQAPLGFWDKMIGTKDTLGWAMPALKTFGGLASVYLGMKQYGLMKDQFRFNKKLGLKNLENQTTSYNTRLRDRQIARNAANKNSTPVDQYMDKNRLTA